MIKNICVFCGSKLGSSPEYARVARDMGALLALRGIGLVYGGGGTGIMGVLADSVLQNGGNVIGVIPGGMARAEIMHSAATKMHVVDTMHDRKAMMCALSDAFVALPGGIGTFEEICEAITWFQLSIHAKPCGLLNVAGYFDPFVSLLRHSSERGFSEGNLSDFVAVHADPVSLIDALTSVALPNERYWQEPA